MAAVMKRDNEANSTALLPHMVHEILPEHILRLVYPDFSPTYAGDRTNPRNRSANIPNTLNTAVWITNLPIRTTHTQLLARIRNTGRIYACVINPPDAEMGHRNAAAKIVFFELHAAQKFYVDAQSIAGFEVGGRRTRVAWNRIKTAEQENSGVNSRVLIITGRTEFVNAKSLTEYFETKFKFEIDKIATIFNDGGLAVVEYRFGSYRCQAEIGRMALLREKRDEVFRVQFGADPCASAPTLKLKGLRD
jgi:hypothetical protein